MIERHWQGRVACMSHTHGSRTGRRVWVRTLSGDVVVLVGAGNQSMGASGSHSKPMTLLYSTAARLQSRPVWRRGQNF